MHLNSQQISELTLKERIHLINSITGIKPAKLPEKGMFSYDEVYEVNTIGFGNYNGRNGGRKFTANCGYSQGYSVREVIDTVKRISGNDFRVIETERRAGDIESLTANASRLMTRLEWAPRHDDLETIISTALDWEKKLPSLKKSA